MTTLQLQEATNSPESRENPLTWVLVLGLLAWSLFVTMSVQGITLFLAWSTDLSKLFSDAQTLLAFGILQPFLIGLPAILLLLLRGQRQAAVVRTLLLAAILSCFLLIPRLFLSPEAASLAAFMRAGIGMITGSGLLVWAARRKDIQMRPGAGFGLAMLIGALFLMPWLVYGALGDWFDSLIAGLQSVALALLAAGLAAYLMPRLYRRSDHPHRNIWLGGATLAIALVALAGAWGQMDYQALLIGILPGLGFPLALWGIDQRRYDVWSAILLVIIATFGALAFADAREIRLILLLSGETPVWAFRATTLNFVLGWMVFWVVGLFNARLLGRSMTRFWAVGAGVAAVLAAMLYLFIGQPLSHGDNFLVVFKEQADLTPAYTIHDIDERRAWVYETLVAQADATQTDLMAWLDQRSIPYTRYYLVNAIEVDASVLRRWQLQRRQDVDRTLYSPQLRPVPETALPEAGNNFKPDEVVWGIEATRAADVWSEFGISGEGVTVGLSDTGVDAAHPALASTYRGRETGDAYNWFDPWTDSPTPFDANGHGTHTLGTAVGQQGVGMAPGANWFACANLVRAFGNAAVYLDCMQFMLAPHPPEGDPLHEGRPDLAADISTNSWGCPPALEGCDQLTLWQATEALKAAGIFFVAAAGNEGPACNSLITPPGNYKNVFSVGAIDAGGNLASFSNRGPDTQAPDGASSPEVLAPGTDIISAWPDNGWHSISGTSMATPHVAGVVALMWSANPALRGQMETTRAILIETAAPYIGSQHDCDTSAEQPDSATGYGIVDAYAAVERALALR